MTACRLIARYPVEEKIRALQKEKPPSPLQTAVVQEESLEIRRKSQALRFAM